MIIHNLLSLFSTYNDHDIVYLNNLGSELCQAKNYYFSPKYCVRHVLVNSTATELLFIGKKILDINISGCHELKELDFNKCVNNLNGITININQKLINKPENLDVTIKIN